MREKKRPKFRNEKRLLNFGRKREKSLGVVSWNINSTVGALQGMKRGRESKGCEVSKSNTEQIKSKYTKCKDKAHNQRDHFGDEHKLGFFSFFKMYSIFRS